MQKLILSIFCSFLSMLLLAQQPKSNLTISSTSNNNIRITLNGYKYTLQDRSTTFQALQPGNYPLVIYQWKNSWRGGGQYEKVYDANIRLNAGKHLEITVMRFGKTSWDEGNIEADNWADRTNNPYPDDDNRNRDRDRDNRNTEPTIYKTDGSQFALIKKAVSNESFDDDKLRMAKVSMKEASLSTSQIKELLNLFYSDDKKLDLAKFAYDKCWEKNVYFTLAESLSFSSNKKALIDFIAGK
jgi:Domain of unknown function (DUF4476)